LSPAREMSCTVPTGLRSSRVESASPTLKRGANEHCASGAATRALLIQQSITVSEGAGGGAQWKNLLSGSAAVNPASPSTSCRLIAQTN
jgi:hypothetical protein